MSILSKITAYLPSMIARAMERIAEKLADVKPNKGLFDLFPGQDNGAGDTPDIGDNRPDFPTTFLIGEDDNSEPGIATTLALGEEDDGGYDVTTLAIGEEDDDLPEATTKAIGEEDDDAPIFSTKALGEEDDDTPIYTTLAIGEEDDDASPPDVTTMAFGEEEDDIVSTHALGEEDGLDDLKPLNNGGVEDEVSLALGDQQDRAGEIKEAHDIEPGSLIYDLPIWDDDTPA